MDDRKKGSNILNRDNDQRSNRRKSDRDRNQMPSQGPGMGGQPMMPPPGFPPGGPGMGGPSMTPPPGYGPQPSMAPPNFIPEMPDMNKRQMGEPTGFGTQYHSGSSRYREFRRCMNRFTYIWLFNGDGFWFVPTFVDRQFVMGFRWRKNRWVFDRINMNRILFFRCF